MVLRRKRVVSSLVLAIALLVLGLGSLAAQDVRTNYMPGTDFSKYKTYKWVSIPGAERPNQILDQQIRQAVDAQLAAKKFTKTDDDKADLYVAYQVSIDQERQWNAYGMGGGWRFGGMATATSSTIQIGALALDIYDAGPKQLVWQGQATKTLNPSKNPEKNQERIIKAVMKLLKTFPPR